MEKSYREMEAIQNSSKKRKNGISFFLCLATSEARFFFFVNSLCFYLHVCVIKQKKTKDKEQNPTKWIYTSFSSDFEH